MHLGEKCYDWCTEYHPELFPDGITNGAGWYSLNGGMQDWMYENTNEFDITLEIGCNQYPPADALPEYWEFNKKALLSYIQTVHKGIKGTVRDTVSGKYLPDVKVHVKGRSHPVTSTKYGDYFRLLVPGIYEILFERAGYESQQVTVIIQDTMPQILEIELKPLNSTSSSGDDEDKSSTTSSTPTDVTAEKNQSSESDDHSLVVATLVMTIITVLILVLMIGAYIIQKRRLSRSQSMSVELQPRSASTGISLPLHGNATSGGSSSHLGA